MAPEKRTRIKRTFYEPEPLPVTAEKKRKIGGISYQSEWRSIDRDFRRRWKENVRRYKAMGINDKIEFAKTGYKFPDQPDCPAILTSPSSIRMPRGSNNGVIAHKLFVNSRRVSSSCSASWKWLMCRMLVICKLAIKWAFMAAGSSLLIRWRCLLMG